MKNGKRCRTNGESDCLESKMVPFSEKPICRRQFLCGLRQDLPAFPQNQVLFSLLQRYRLRL
jgi:hypothetical protein